MNEKMNPDEEISKATNNDLNEESSNEINSSVNDFSCIHVLISFIINLGLLIIAIIEFVIKKDCLIFNYLVDIFILMVFIFTITYFFTKKKNYLNGFVYYPLCSLFWGTSDILSNFYVEDSHDWCNSDLLKIIKISLIGLTLIINIKYMKFFKK